MLSPVIRCRLVGVGVSQWPDESCLLPFITGFFGKADALANGQAVKAARSNTVPMKVNLAIIGCCDEAVILKERSDYAVRRHLMGAAARFLAAPQHLKMHDERLWDLRQKRDREMHSIAEWEELRSLASAIKEHALTHLDEYLEQFEGNAQRNGVHVHWARDAAEHNRIVHGILKDHGAKSLIKSKSMLTEECGFRHYMASVGIDVIETDLGERIQQLDHEDPSHVVVPAVHKLRTDVAEVFAKTMAPILTIVMFIT